MLPHYGLLQIRFRFCRRLDAQGSGPRAGRGPRQRRAIAARCARGPVLRGRASDGRLTLGHVELDCAAEEDCRVDRPKAAFAEIYRGRLAGGRQPVYSRQMPLERANISDAAASAVRAMIIEGELSEGERINEVHLAEKLGVSRTPLREALNRLAAEGTIFARPRLGYYVRPLTLAELE